ncbi:MAG: hypothetical protein F6K11_11715 [Leptolyngbya sp. SIO3F4]|nr:hypothetical protein [Leptolyngbya sp. SIO3F4]
MKIDERQLASGFRSVRQRYINNIDRAAVEIGLCSSSLTKRELGTYSIKLIELLRLAWSVEKHPVTLLWEILDDCDLSFWNEVAEKLNCTPAIAKKRLTEEAANRGIEVWQLWRKIEKSQITLP